MKNYLSKKQIEIASNIAADVLTPFAFVNSMEDFQCVYDKRVYIRKLSKNHTEIANMVVADILKSFASVKNMEDFKLVFNKVYEQYYLFDDPFTHLPCSMSEYSKNSLEYQRQLMFDKYGHCDGLD